MTCPSCKGKGHWEGYGCPGFKPMSIPCDICKGTGELPEGMVYDSKQGNALKETRLDHRLTLREAAKIMEISVSELSQRERGFFHEPA